MDFCTKCACPCIKFRKQPQVTVHRGIQHGNRNFDQKYLTETHILRYISPSPAYDNTGALYAIGFSLYDEIPPFQRQTARIFHTYCKGRKEGTRENNGHIGRVCACVSVIHVKRTLIDIQSAWRRRRRRGKRGNETDFWWQREGRGRSARLSRSRVKIVTTASGISSQFCHRNLKYFSWIKVEDTESASNRPWTVCRDGRIWIDGGNIRSPAAATRKSSTAIMSGSHAQMCISLTFKCAHRCNFASFFICIFFYTTQ